MTLSVKKQNKKIKLKKKINPLVRTVPSIKPDKCVLREICSSTAFVLGESNDSLIAPINHIDKLNTIESTNEINPLSVKLEANKFIAT